VSFSILTCSPGRDRMRMDKRLVGLT